MKYYCTNTPYFFLNSIKTAHLTHCKMELSALYCGSVLSYILHLKNVIGHPGFMYSNNVHFVYTVHTIHSKIKHFFFLIRDIFIVYSFVAIKNSLYHDFLTICSSY